jgi:hypothetical protein
MLLARVDPVHVRPNHPDPGGLAVQDHRTHVQPSLLCQGQNFFMFSCTKISCFFSSLIYGLLEDFRWEKGQPHVNVLNAIAILLKVWNFWPQSMIKVVFHNRYRYRIGYFNLMCDWSLNAT